MAKSSNMYELSECLYLSPEDIRFSQNSISANFSTGEPIGQTLDDLVNMKVFVTDIPPISVAMEGDIVYTMNNRRLWVFKKLSAMNKCNFIPCIVEQNIPRFLFTTVVEGNGIVVRGSHMSETLFKFGDYRPKSKLREIRQGQSTVNRWCYEPQPEHSTDNRRILKGERKLSITENTSDVPKQTEDKTDNVPKENAKAKGIEVQVKNTTNNETSTKDAPCSNTSANKENSNTKVQSDVFKFTAKSKSGGLSKGQKRRLAKRRRSMTNYYNNCANYNNMAATGLHYNNFYAPPHQQYASQMMPQYQFPVYHNYGNLFVPARQQGFCAPRMSFGMTYGYQRM